MLKKPMLSVAQVKHTSDIGRNLDQIQEFLKEHDRQLIDRFCVGMTVYPYSYDRLQRLEATL